MWGSDLSEEGLDERWSSALPKAQLKESLVSKIETRKHGKVVAASDDGITAAFGSQVIFRLKGAWLAKSRDSPLRAELTSTDEGAGSAVEVRITNAMGFGIKAGTRRGYDKAFDELAAHLREGLAR